MEINRANKKKVHQYKKKIRSAKTDVYKKGEQPESNKSQKVLPLPDKQKKGEIRNQSYTITPRVRNPPVKQSKITLFADKRKNSDAFRGNGNGMIIRNKGRVAIRSKSSNLRKVDKFERGTASEKDSNKGMIVRNGGRAVIQSKSSNLRKADKFESGAASEKDNNKGMIVRNGTKPVIHRKSDTLRRFDSSERDGTSNSKENKKSIPPEQAAIRTEKKRINKKVPVELPKLKPENQRYFDRLPTNEQHALIKEYQKGCEKTDSKRISSNKKDKNGAIQSGVKNSSKASSLGGANLPKKGLDMMVEEHKSNKKLMKEILSNAPLDGTDTSRFSTQHMVSNNIAVRVIKEILHRIRSFVTSTFMIVLVIFAPIAIPILIGILLLLVIIIFITVIAVGGSVFGLLANYTPFEDQGDSIQGYIHEKMLDWEETIKWEINFSDGAERVVVTYTGMEESNYNDILVSYLANHLTCTYDVVGDGDVNIDSLIIEGIDNTYDLNERTAENMNNLDVIFEEMNWCQVAMVEKSRDGGTDEDGNGITDYYYEKHVWIHRTPYTQFVSGWAGAEQRTAWAIYSLLTSAEYDGDYITSLPPDEYEKINENLVPGEIGSEVVKTALTKLGTPYSQAKRNQEGYFDCSSFTYWAWRQHGVTISNGGSNVAAAQAKYIVDNDLAVSRNMLASGDLIFWSTGNNGRFMNVTHVGIYVGNNMVVDASSSRGQVVYREMFSVEHIVLYGRPYENYN